MWLMLGKAPFRLSPDEGHRPSSRATNAAMPGSCRQLLGISLRDDMVFADMAAAYAVTFFQQGCPMFPLRDDIPTHTIPWLNYAIIGACVVVFFAEARTEDDGEAFVYQYGMVPARFQHADEPLTIERRDHRGRLERVILPPSPVSPWVTLFTCMFLHGGLMHIVGNMWFLYIFGDNVEDRYSHVGYAMLYLASGIAAGGLHYLSGPNSTVPTVGASGAIAGVMGAYIVMFPSARVITLLPLGVFSQIISVPAWLFLGFWFVFQLISASTADVGGGGVAWWAHVGGFATGLLATGALKSAGFLGTDFNRPERPRAWQQHRAPWM